VLKKCCIRGEICARFGGDEFVVFATDYSEDDAKSFCDRFVLGVDEYNSSSGKPYNVDASMGFTVFVPEPNVSLFTMISLADNKMYEEKKKKRHSKYLRRSDS
jgi:diguanylate cyclase (GGDEF)-like protein